MGGRRYEKIITGATAFDRFLVRTMWGTDKFIPLLFEMLDSVAADCNPGFRGRRLQPRYAGVGAREGEGGGRLPEQMAGA